MAEIAAHELVTHVDIGPYDLALSLGMDYYARPPPGEHDPLAAAVITCREAAAACGKVLLGAWGEPEEMLAAGDHFMMVADRDANSGGARGATRPPWRHDGIRFLPTSY